MLLSTKMENKVKLETKNNSIKERNVKRFRFKMCLFISNAGCFFFLKKFLSNRNYVQLLPLFKNCHQYNSGLLRGNKHL